MNKMNKWVLIPIIVVLAIGTITNGVFYLQESSKLKDAESRIATLEGNVPILEGGISTLEGNFLAVEGEVSTLEAYDRAVIEVVAVLEPTVVRIETSEGDGSGVIIARNGYVLTNQHLVEGATSIGITLMGGERYDATVIYWQKDWDLAILKISSTRTDFPEAVLGSSADVIVGEGVVAIGYAYRLEGQATFSRGIVSAVRTVNGFEYVQTDATINKGNSGGPLVNLKGEVIGINAGFLDEGLGLNFAVPIDKAKLFIQYTIGG